MFAFLLLFPILFFSTNSEFFEQVEKDRANGATWQEIDPKPLDPNAKALPLQCMSPVEHGDDEPCGEPYVIYKLKMPEDK